MISSGEMSASVFVLWASCLMLAIASAAVSDTYFPQSTVYHPSSDETSTTASSGSLYDPASSFSEYSSGSPSDVSLQRDAEGNPAPTTIAASSDLAPRDLFVTSISTSSSGSEAGPTYTQYREHPLKFERAVVPRSLDGTTNSTGNQSSVLFPSTGAASSGIFPSSGYPAGVFFGGGGSNGGSTGWPTGWPTGWSTGLPTGWSTGLPTGWSTGLPTGWSTLYTGDRYIHPESPKYINASSYVFSSMSETISLFRPDQKDFGVTASTEQLDITSSVALSITALNTTSSSSLSPSTATIANLTTLNPTSSSSLSPSTATIGNLTRSASPGMTPGDKTVYITTTIDNYTSSSIATTTTQPMWPTNSSMNYTSLDCSPVSTPYQIASMVWTSYDVERPAAAAMSLCNTMFDGNATASVVMNAQTWISTDMELLATFEFTNLPEADVANVVNSTAIMSVTDCVEILAYPMTWCAKFYEGVTYSVEFLSGVWVNVTMDEAEQSSWTGDPV